MQPGQSRYRSHQAIVLRRTALDARAIAQSIARVQGRKALLARAVS